MSPRILILVCFFVEFVRLLVCRVVFGCGILILFRCFPEFIRMLVALLCRCFLLNRVSSYFDSVVVLSRVCSNVVCSNGVVVFVGSCLLVF